MVLDSDCVSQCEELIDAANRNIVASKCALGKDGNAKTDNMESKASARSAKNDSNSADNAVTPVEAAKSSGSSKDTVVKLALLSLGVVMLFGAMHW